MIKSVETEDVPGLFELFRKTYKKHSILEKGEEWYSNKLSNDGYVGFIFVEDEKILAHAGVEMAEDFCLINCLVTDKSLRGRGIGRKLFEYRESFCDNTDKNFIIGYSMMQHPYSQLLYSEDFKSIGMVINYSDIFNKADKSFNKGNSNAELVLCKRINKKEEIKMKIPKLSPENELYKRIIDTLGIDPDYETESITPEGKIFLGLNPDVEDGLFTLEFSDHDPNIDFSLMAATTKEREEFRDEIRKSYESFVL